LIAIILGDPNWFKILRVGFLGDVGGEGGEAVVIVIIVVLVGTVSSPCLDDASRVAAIIDLLPMINCGSILEAGLRWSFALRPCITLVARWASGLLHLLLDIATCRLLALGIAMADWIVLVALVIIIPPISRASYRGASNLRSVTMALRSREHVPSGGHWVLPIECTSARWVRYCSL
jgi:hypothetical protein